MFQLRAYTIFWSAVGDEDSLRTTRVSAPITRYVVSGLRAETTYQIAVAGVNRGGTGNRTTLTIQTDQAELPSPPQALKLDSTMTNTIAVSWKPPNIDGGAAITTYTISWSAVGDGDDSGTDDVLVSTTSYVVSGLRPQTCYQIAVAAVNRVGRGSFSQMLPFRTGSNMTVPSIPRNLEAVVTTETITIDWRIPANDGGCPITEYVVVWSSVSDESKTSSVRITEEPLAMRYMYEITEIGGENLLPETGESLQAMREQRTQPLAIILKIQVLLEGALQ